MGKMGESRGAAAGTGEMENGPIGRVDFKPWAGSGSALAYHIDHQLAERDHSLLRENRGAERAWRKPSPPGGSKWLLRAKLGPGAPFNIQALHSCLLPCQIHQPRSRDNSCSVCVC